MVKISCQNEKDIMEAIGTMHIFHPFMKYKNTTGCIRIKLELFTLKAMMDESCNLICKISMVNPL